LYLQRIIPLDTVLADFLYKVIETSLNWALNRRYSFSSLFKEIFSSSSPPSSYLEGVKIGSGSCEDSFNPKHI
jgi:hypothetical protein